MWSFYFRGKFHPIESFPHPLLCFKVGLFSWFCPETVVDRSVAVPLPVVMHNAFLAVLIQILGRNKNVAAKSCVASLDCGRPIYLGPRRLPLIKNVSFMKWCVHEKWRNPTSFSKKKVHFKSSFHLRNFLRSNHYFVHFSKRQSRMVHSPLVDLLLHHKVNQYSFW